MREPAATQQALGAFCQLWLNTRNLDAFHKSLGLNRDLLLLACQYERANTLPEGALKTSRLLYFRKRKSPQFLFDSPAIVRHQGIGNSQYSCNFKLSGLRRAQITMPQDAEYSVVL